MAYNTSNTTSTDEALEYASAEGSMPEIRSDALLRDAERIVKRYAPPPTVITAAYTVPAKDCEMRVFDYLQATSGYLSSTNVAGISESYDLLKIEGIVKDAMSGVSLASTSKLRSVPLERG